MASTSDAKGVIPRRPPLRGYGSIQRHSETPALLRGRKGRLAAYFVIKTEFSFKIAQISEPEPFEKAGVPVPVKALDEEDHYPHFRSVWHPYFIDLCALIKLIFLDNPPQKKIIISAFPQIGTKNHPE
jgi:hypothetical protein